jgi:hypothetical protein
MDLVPGQESHRCARCGEVKAATEFYVDNRSGGLRSYCKPCERVVGRTRVRTPNALRFLRNRARQRSLSRLRELHREEYEHLFVVELERAVAEADAHAPLVRDISGTYVSDSPVPLLMPGPRPADQTTADRIVVVRVRDDGGRLCPDCASGHAHGHICRHCGSRPSDPRWDPEQCPRCEPNLARLARL